MLEARTPRISLRDTQDIACEELGLGNGAELALTIGFGASGNSLGYLGGGWARAEPDFTWATGPESHVMFQRVHDVQDYILTLDVVPFIHPPELPDQRLIVSVNSRVVGSCVIARPSLLGYRIPADLVGQSERSLITLQHPDATCPADFPGNEDDRSLAFAVREIKLYRQNSVEHPAEKRLPDGLMLSSRRGRGAGGSLLVDTAQWVAERTGLDLPGLALKFESLGENCEFGLVQRRCDAEPLGLLRFSSTFLRNLIRGLDSEFEGLGDAEDVDPRLEGDARKEFMVHEKRYGLVYHTFVYEGQRSLWLMKEQESARLKFLRRKFLEELEAGDKIFVYKRNVPVFEEEILPLFMALSRHAGNTLLWVVPAERDRPPGTVEILRQGLLKGYIDRFALEDNAHDFSFDGWITVCANAYLLSRLQKASA